MHTKRLSEGTVLLRHSVTMVTPRSKSGRINAVNGSRDYMLLTILRFYAVLCSFSLFCSAEDSIKEKNSIAVDGVKTLVSTGKNFELGFFTLPGAPHKKRYLGIWYYKLNPQTVVWVANRDNPLSAVDGVFAISDGNLKILDANGKSYWATDLKPSSSTTLVASLDDLGNLVLRDDHSQETRWQSFENATDTFLAGMDMSESTQLTSWKDQYDPGRGNFTFKLDQGKDDRYVIYKNDVDRYWGNGDVFLSSVTSGFDAIAFMLSNFSRSPKSHHYYNATVDFSYTRLVMSYTGELLFLSWDGKEWSSLWREPRDKCSVFNACGNYGSCNIYNKHICKCLPGFEPISLDAWNSRIFSNGCTRKPSFSCKNDAFLSLTMMKVGNPDIKFLKNTEKECRTACLTTCDKCQAYSFQPGSRMTRTSSTCYIWSENLKNLQEEYADGGQNISVRVAVSYLEQTTRSCKPCGTNVIPYPLSTGQSCGDHLYSIFQCDISTGQIIFKAASGSYRVTWINQDARKFYIQAKCLDHCEARNSGPSILGLDQSSPFNVTNWLVYGTGDNIFDLPHEIEVGWEPLLEPPTCNSSADCKSWPRSSCSAEKDGNRRCLCHASFHWDTSKLNCTKEENIGQLKRKTTGKNASRYLIIVALSLGCVIILSSTAIFYIWRRKTAIREGVSRQSTIEGPFPQLRNVESRFKDLICSTEFEDEDRKGIDVPFFALDSILSATNNFSDRNKLGKGGYGPVYRAEFAGGQEMAVKRLLSISGQGFQEFKNEVVLIAKLQHRNLVRLLGYCVEGGEKILLYEYMPNKSLDTFLFDQKLSVLLDWGIRYNIILGIARGLLYLHQDSRLRIIHRDLKTSNILLDRDMNPKISDFGLAKIVAGNQTEANTIRVVGTYGYMSPEYALDGIFSVKSDVFSFGVVLLEIISGRKNTGFYQSEQALSLLGYAWKLWTEDNIFDLMDPALKASCSRSEFLKCMNVALLCVQEDPQDRPSVAKVVTMLSGDFTNFPNPRQPAFVLRRGQSSSASSSSKPESVNVLTTTLQGR